MSQRTQGHLHGATLTARLEASDGSGWDGGHSGQLMWASGPGRQARWGCSGDEGCGRDRGCYGLLLSGRNLRERGTGGQKQIAAEGSGEQLRCSFLNEKNSKTQLANKWKHRLKQKGIFQKPLPGGPGSCTCVNWLRRVVGTDTWTDSFPAATRCQPLGGGGRGGRMPYTPRGIPSPSVFLCAILVM